MFPCIISVITIDNQQDATVLFYLLLLGGKDLSQVQPICNISQQQHRWTIPEAVVTVICSHM